MSKDFLDNLKVGDNVGIRHHYQGIRLLVIKRMTKTMIITDHGRYYKENGNEVGGNTWYSCSLLEATKEFIDEHYTVQLYRRVRELIEKEILEKLNKDELAVIYKILKAKDK